MGLERKILCVFEEAFGGQHRFPLEVHLSPPWGLKKDYLKEMTHELNLEDMSRIREGKR